MHELSIALSILDIAADEAERRGATVHAVHVKLGALSGVVKEALVSAYELAREESPCPGSALVIEDVAVTVYCETCGTERPVESIQSIRCAICGTPSGRVVTGRELEVTALEIEE
jgi:hydrogenase nickel incorporation protein HypA/HybF